MPFRPAPPPKKGKTPPPEETSEEALYLKSLGEKQQPVSIKLVDGEIVTGWVEYYDRSMVRLTREGAPNLFIFKHEIMYIADDPIAPGDAVRAEVSARAPKERKRRAPRAAHDGSEGAVNDVTDGNKEP